VPAGVVCAHSRSGAQRWALNAVPPGGPGRTVCSHRAPQRLVDHLGRAARNLVFLRLARGNDFYGDRNGLDYYRADRNALDARAARAYGTSGGASRPWDYDMPSQPTLVDLMIDGQTVPALVEVTKMGLTFVLNRETGSPFPVEENRWDGAVEGERPARRSRSCRCGAARAPRLRRRGVGIHVLDKGARTR
jgi:quinoprotein glucose dehydrogenase